MSYGVPIVRILKKIDRAKTHRTVFAIGATPAKHPSQCRHNECDGVSNHQPQDRLLNRLFKAQIKENIKAPRHWLCEVNSPVTGEFPTQMASNAEYVSIWWRHHALINMDKWITEIHQQVTIQQQQQ